MPIDLVCICGAGMMGLRTAARLEAEGIPWVRRTTGASARRTLDPLPV